MIVGNRFKISTKLNAGSFGQIHLAQDIKTKQRVAVKLQPIKTKHPQLEYEAKLLAYLTDQIDPRQYGLPRIHYYGKFDKYHAMVMDLLGPSLEELFQRCDKQFDLKTVIMIGIQIIDRLKFLHRKKFIHRDIKPQNFLLGMNQYCGQVFMIDLGLSKKYKQKNGEHIPYRDDRSLKGTPRYTSLNSHLGIEQSRRDDLESVIYMLIYFLKGQLPWQNLKPDQNYDRYEKILEKKLSVSVQNLCSGLPDEFKELVAYTRGLHFIEDPNYELIKKLLEQAALNNDIQLKDNDLYCWEKQPQQQEQAKPKNYEPQAQKENHFASQQSQEKQKDSQHPYSQPVRQSTQKIGSDQNIQQKPKNVFENFNDSVNSDRNNNEGFNFSKNDSKYPDPFNNNGSGSGDPFDEFNQNRDSINDDNPFAMTGTQKQNQSYNNPFGTDSYHQDGKNNHAVDEKDDPFADYEYRDPEVMEL